MTSVVVEALRSCATAPPHWTVQVDVRDWQCGGGGLVSGGVCVIASEWLEVFGFCTEFLLVR